MTNSEHIPNGQVSDERLAHLEANPTHINPVYELPAIVRLARSALTRRSSAGVKGLDEAAKRVCLSTGLDWDALPEAAENDGTEDREWFRMLARAALSSPPHIGEDDGADFYAVQGSGGYHIGLWDDKETAEEVLRDPDYVGARLIPLYIRPSPSVPPQGETSEWKIRERYPDELVGYYSATGPGDLRIRTNDEPLLRRILAAITPSPTLEPTDAEVEQFVLNPLHIDLLNRGAKGQFIWFHDRAELHSSEMYAVGQLCRAGLARMSEPSNIPGPPCMPGFEITDAGRAALIASRQSTSGEGV